MEDSQRTCSQWEILRIKSPLVQPFKPLPLPEQPDMVAFAHHLHELVTNCQQFGKMYHPAVPKESKGSIKIAKRWQTMDLSVETLDKEGEPYIRPVDSLRCELVASDGSSRVRGTVEKTGQNIYTISYQPQVVGEHQLLLMEECPLFTSPSTVTVLPDFTAPAKVIEDLRQPYGIAVREGGEVVVVAEKGGHCVSIIRANGKKKSFGSRGSGPRRFRCPEGLAIDAEGNIIVGDCSNHCIQRLSSTGKHNVTVGTEGSGPLQFRNPGGITVHPHTGKVYVADRDNHRIQILNSDLTYSSSFGCEGSSNGKFSYPQNMSTDREGNVYVADRGNHRIQVFTADGVYQRQFGKWGTGEGELNSPVCVAVDSHNYVYVGEWANNRVSVFSTDGEFIVTFGRRGKGRRAEFSSPFGLAVDKKGRVHVSDTGNDRIQIFT